MFKSQKQVAAPLEKSLNSELIRELAQFEELLKQGESEESTESESYHYSIKILSSGRRVICPNRQNPARNRKHLVRSLLIH